jgi:hypothetical protein
LSLKTTVDGLSVICPQNHWDGLSVLWPQNYWDVFLRFDPKTDGDGFFWFGLKTSGGGFPGLCLKTSSYGLVIWASKSPRQILGLLLKIKQAMVCRLHRKTNGRMR